MFFDKNDMILQKTFINFYFFLQISIIIRHIGDKMS
ncbi:hypothetical protein CK5_13680 [Blautia obeum A2-162]|uniref:Uncharacterized protein n=1 Tax=Blautia obeum A2-162 TaxID=657314 RepID=D4LYV6_9FIRM|nr:hypothetical protein CK5_13680 [Blautia obeum A2-162]